jgi:hypothetical protein
LLALRSHGLFHLHSACVALDDGTAWAMPGESDAGKSTLALALCSAGATYVSDDAVFLRSAGSGVEVVGYPRMLRMTERTAAAFPRLRPLLAPSPRGSARQLELDPRRAFAGHLRAVAPVVQVLAFPRAGEAPESQVTPLDRSQGFGRLLHACAWVASEHLPHRAEQLGLLARLSDRARAYDVTVGRQILSEPEAVVADLRRRLR